MADPFAPPAEAPRRRTPAAVAARPAADPSWTPAAAPAPADRMDRAEPARPGPFWMVAAVGVGLLCLAHLLRFFVVVDDIPDEQVAPTLLGVLGVVALAAGLALAAVLQRGLAVAWRIALLLGAGYFAAQGAGTGLLGLFGSGLFG